jgi:membrane fusion protein, multidrug efflux system
MTVSPGITERPAARHGRHPPLLVGLVMIAVASGAYLGWQHFAHGPSAANPEPPPAVPVIAATVKQQNFPIVLIGVGNVTALNSATVRSMVTELILSIDFKDGQFVKKGQLLAQLDPSTYQARFDEAEANLARDQAHLENGRINLGRYIPLEKTRLCYATTGYDPRSEKHPDRGRYQSRPGGDRVHQNRAELYETGGAI